MERRFNFSWVIWIFLLLLFQPVDLKGIRNPNRPVASLGFHFKGMFVVALGKSMLYYVTEKTSRPAEFRVMEQEVKISLVDH